MEINQQRHRVNLYRQAQNISMAVPVIPLAHGVQFRVMTAH